MNLDERIARLQTYHLEGRIIRNSWHEGEKTSDGYERACLLAAFSPEADEAENAFACPASAMPPWLARLTPSLDDNVSEEAWPSVIARYVEVLPKLVRLPTERLVQLDFETRAIAVRETRQHTTDPKALEAIDGVLVLLDRAAGGQEVSNGDWAAAAYAAEAATYAAAADAARAAAYAEAAEAAAAEAAAEAAARAAAYAAEAAAAYAAEAAEAARNSSWDRMTDAMLSAWEKAVAE